MVEYWYKEYQKVIPKILDNKDAKGSRRAA
jgi:hypothetical protein